MLVVAHIAELHNLTVEEVMSDRRMKEIARARQKAVVVLVAQFNMSWSELGRFFGRDHSSMMFAAARYFGAKRASGGMAEVIRVGMAAQKLYLMSIADAALFGAAIPSVPSIPMLEAAHAA